MNVIFLQLVLLCFALFMVYSLFLHWKKKNINNTVFTVWLILWVGFLFITFFPQKLEPLLKSLFIVRVMDLAMILAFMVLIYLTFENNIKIKKYEKDLEKLVRIISLKRKK